MKINVIPDLIGDPYKKEPGSRVKHGMTSGFTLIELLIVIAIISALSAISVMTYTGAQKRARDAQRRSDLKQYQTAIEAYAVKTGSFPFNLSDAIMTSQNMSVLNLPSYPLDPKSGVSTYGYRYCGSVSKYRLYAQLEGVSNNVVYCSDGRNFETNNVGLCPCI